MSRITIGFNVTRDAPSEVQAQARQLIIDALIHFATCPTSITEISENHIALIAEMLNPNQNDLVPIDNDIDEGIGDDGSPE